MGSQHYNYTTDKIGLVHPKQKFKSCIYGKITNVVCVIAITEFMLKKSVYVLRVIFIVSHVDDVNVEN